MLIRKEAVLSIFYCGILTACASVQGAPSSNLAKSETAEVQPAAKLKAGASKTTEEEKICKRTTDTGSRFKKTACLTQRQWDEMSDAAKKSTREFQRRYTSPGLPGR